MSPSAVVRVVWLTLGMLAYWTPGRVSGQETSRNVVLESSRLGTLVAMASRLQENQINRNKRMLSGDPVYRLHGAGDFHRVARDIRPWKTATNSDSDTIGRSDTKLGDKRFFRSLSRRRRGSAMDNLFTYYKLFHDKLRVFLEDLVTRLKPNSPESLQHLPLILHVLPISSKSFTYNDEKDVSQKIAIVISFTNLVLRRISPYVEDASQAWLQSNANHMLVYMQLVKMNLINLKLDTTDDGVEVLDSGIGNINTGAESVSPKDIENLQDLLNLLKNGER